MISEWFHIAKQLLLLLKEKSPDEYKLFIELYGGEEKFKKMWILPEVPSDRGNNPPVDRQKG